METVFVLEAYPKQVRFSKHFALIVGTYLIPADEVLGVSPILMGLSH